MKRETLLSLGLLLCANCFAQDIAITDSKIGEKDNTVSVAFSIGVGKIRSDERLTITPVLCGGNNRMPLTPIVLSGRNRSIADQRNNVLPQGVRTKGNRHIQYNVSVPYESWMGEVSLVAEGKVENCCQERQLATQTILANKTIRYEVVLPEQEAVVPEPSPLEKFDNETTFLAPMKEYEAVKGNFDKLRAEGALVVMFRQGDMTIDPSLGNNARSLAQVRKAFELIEQDSNASLGRILFAGTASPEGSANLNDRLARERARALQNFLQKESRAAIDQVESIAVGEDWVGLRKMVEASDMQHKAEVLDIINNVPVVQGRETKIMELHSGRPYRYMQEHFFPKLRSAGYIRIFYDAKPSADLAKTNEAIGLYNKKEYRNVIERLEGVTPTAVTENISGMCYMMLGEYDKAEKSLTNALRMGYSQAAETLEQLERIKAVERSL